MKTYRIGPFIFLALLLAGCAAPASPENTAVAPQPAASQVQARPTGAPENPTAPPENPLRLTATPEAPAMSSSPAPVEKFVSLSKHDLAGRLGIDPAGILLVDTAERTWPDASLGCPAPGKVYAQGKQPGYLIRLEAGGAQYSYHTDMHGQVIFCPEVDPDAPGGAVSPDPTLVIGPPRD